MLISIVSDKDPHGLYRERLKTLMPLGSIMAADASRERGLERVAIDHGSRRLALVACKFTQQGLDVINELIKVSRTDLALYLLIHRRSRAPPYRLNRKIWQRKYLPPACYSDIQPVSCSPSPHAR